MFEKTMFFEDPRVNVEKHQIFAKKIISENWLVQRDDSSFQQGGLTKTNNCAVCDILAQTGSLQIHIRSFHEGKEPFNCKICDNSCSLNSISLKKPTPIQEQTFKCKFCDFGCASKCTLKKHVDRVHEGKRPHKCTLCDYNDN